MSEPKTVRPDPVDEGARARAAGRPKDACPYPSGSPERDAWIEGYDGIPKGDGPDLPRQEG